MKRGVPDFGSVAPMVQIVRTCLDRSSQNAEMALYGFLFGLLGSGQNATRFTTRSVPPGENGSWTGSWGVVARGLSYQCRAKVEGWL